MVDVKRPRNASSSTCTSAACFLWEEVDLRAELTQAAATSGGSVQERRWRRSGETILSSSDLRVGDVSPERQRTRCWNTCERASRERVAVAISRVGVGWVVAMEIFCSAAKDEKREGTVGKAVVMYPVGQ
ncbi:hypothetical protein BV22DRAFT_652543 [Leucogyrophana mollusca]|uniref:Uncharacterized protein n=1 Tax=Leucogyrophana mollusca TaxID=85980 RepID=A0ACB8BA97_9AGAM|nr:hypothetical protein BV22DRAFT_652543 [Leucogyrophana mollusca]